MYRVKALISTLFLLVGMLNLTAEISEKKLKTLYHHLHPKSVAQHLAFYELYGPTPMGQQALRDTWNLLLGETAPSSIKEITFRPSSSLISAMIALINRPTDQALPIIDEADLQALKKLSDHLSHVHLRGHQAQTESEVLELPLEEIDLARGLFLSQFGADLTQVRLYEALLDLMALQIKAYLSPQATAIEKIQAINQFVFEEMGFRFPPHSVYAKDIDLYTFLPSVLDSRRGVCLGVSILYLCLAQRLALPLEMITPPGHIYIRYRSADQEVNIETTRRGIHIDSEDYLSLETRALQQRTIKEVIGLVHFNQASVFWQQEDYAQALITYQKAEPYLTDDPLLKELMGYIYLFTGQQQMGEQLLHQIKDYVPDYALSSGTIAIDYLEGQADLEGIKAIFKTVDKNRQSILSKKELLESVVNRHPRFRTAIFQLAIAWIQLYRTREALQVLQLYQNLEPDDPEANYYLAVLYGQRLDYSKAWKHLRQAEDFVIKFKHAPKILKKLRQTLERRCPE